MSLLFLGAHSAAASGPLRDGPAWTVGMSQKALDQAADILASEIRPGRISAASICVARKGTVVLARGFGRLSPEEGAPGVDADSIFLLASITKPVTACALMLLVDRGLVSLEDPVSRYLPEFRNGQRDHVSVRHLLSHTSGLPDMLPENMALRRVHAPLS